MTACGGTNNSNSDSGSSTEGSKHTIGIVLKSLNSDYWNVFAVGIRQSEQDLDCTELLQGPPSETSYDAQLNMIETMLSAGA